MWHSSRSRCAAGLPTKRRRVTSRIPKCVVLDIEGTVTPITFVTDTLFPYVKSHVRSFLEATFDSAETQEAIKMLASQADQVCMKIMELTCD